jgi:hypothetical protein
MAVETKEVIHKNENPLKVLLQKTANGYNWEVHVSGSNVSEMLLTVREINNKLKGVYGEGKK